jgi:hypothetical protein
MHVTSHPFSSIHSISLFSSTLFTLSLDFLFPSTLSSSQFLAPILPLKSLPMSIHSSLFSFIASSTRLLVVLISFHSMHPSSSPFSLIPNFNPVIVLPVALPFFFSFFVHLPSHLYSFGSNFPLCTSSPVSVFFVHLTFYSLSLYTFSRRFIVSYSLLLLKIFLQFLLPLIPYKPFPVYLHLPVCYFYLFSSISFFSSHLS